MTELPPLLRDRAGLAQRFAEGLERMLAQHDGLGVFILALANARHEPAVDERLRRPLEARFAALRDQVRATLAAGRTLPDAADDQEVFLRLALLGLEALPPTRYRQAGPWRLQYNLLRALRPPRMAHVRVSALHKPFDPDGFHFDRPFLRKEILWEGTLLGRAARLLYNKFPFAPLHGLLVLEPEAHRPQYLREADHHLAWRLCRAAGEGMPGFGLGYNSHGAYASVNHQHFQSFALEADERLPVEAPCWRHNGGDADYPLDCRRLTDPEAAWEAIEHLHREGRAYNLLYRPGILYLLPRHFQGSYRHAAWTGGFAWSETSGAITTFNADDFASLDAAAIEAELGKLRQS